MVSELSFGIMSLFEVESNGHRAESAYEMLEARSGFGRIVLQK